MEVLNSYIDSDGKYNYSIALRNEYALILKFETEQTTEMLNEYIENHITKMIENQMIKVGE